MTNEKDTVKYIRYKKDKGKSKPDKPDKTNKDIIILSTNVAGVVTGKLASLNAEVKAAKANIVTIQETHSTRKGKIVMPKEFVIFDSICKAKNGGTIIAVHEDLKPKLVEEYNDPFELIVVEVETDTTNVRMMTGVGPQENWDETKRMPFFIKVSCSGLPHREDCAS